MAEDHRPLTPKEVADLFRVDSKTVARWAAQGKIRYFKTVGGHRRYERAEVERLIRQGDDGR